MKKNYTFGNFWQHLLAIFGSVLFLTTALPTIAQPANSNTIEDSCTIYISTGYYGDNGWNNSYLQLMQQGQVVATVQHHQWTPETYSVTIPANEKTDFNWISDNTQVSFYILSSAGDILYNFRNSSQPGVFFSYHVCSSPRNVSDISVTPDAESPQGATISWTNPSQTVNNDPLQTIDSIVLLKNGIGITTLYDLTPGADTQYTDLTFQSGDYYTVIAYNGPAESSPLYATGPSCRYRLVMETGWDNWFGAMLRFSSKGHFIGEFSLPHHGSETQYVYLPNDWISIEHQDINGSFALYDEDNNLVLSGPDGLPERFQWYNGCSLSVPDTATALCHAEQGNVVNLVWTNPAVSVNGDALTAISKVEVRRNEELIHTFTETIPGGQLSFTDTNTGDGTYLYSVQCFNEAGGGVPAIAHVTNGSNWTLHDFSNNGLYTDTTCLVNITNDASYTNGGIVTVTVFQSDTTKMLRISGSSTLTDGTNISVYAGTPENGVRLSSDTLCVTTTYRSASFVMDIPAGSSPQFHYAVECVNSVYEQPDTNIAIVPDSNGIIYVTQEGAGLRNGSSWANATPCLNRALGIADTMTEKPVIWVAAGIYYGTPQMVDNKIYAFVGRNGVNVYGGFAGIESADYNLALRNFEQNETVLDGLFYHTVAFINAEWNGFHIKNGLNGCYLPASSLLKKCIISNCAENGVTNNDYYAVIDSCTIVDNNGNGIAMRYANITNSKVARNGQAGISLLRGIVHNCSVSQNGGNGVYIYDYVAVISNSLIVNNDQSGVVLYDGGTILNSTIANNQGNGVGIRFSSRFRNSIISGNGGVSICNIDGWANNHEIVNCAIEGDYQLSSNNNILLSSTDNLSDIQPGFVSPTPGCGKAYGEGDYHLLPNSVCVNRGKICYNNVNPDFWILITEANDILHTIDSFPATDLDGNVRVQQGIPDIGAYESNYTQAMTNYFIHPDTNNILYVKASGTGDGSSWQNATSNLTMAIEMAWLYGSNTQVWVAEGTYPTDGFPYYVKENMKLFGGFVGDEPADYDVNVRNPLAHPSVLDGQYQNRVLHQTIDFEQASVVDGFMLTRGQAETGAGAYLMSNTNLSKCRIVNNIVTGEGSAVVTAVHDTLKQLIVENNEGTGVNAESSHLIHCTVVKNNGYGIHLLGNTMLDFTYLCNSIIWGNTLHNLHFTSAMAQDYPPVQNCAIENQLVNGENNIILSSDNGNESGPHFINPTDSVGVVANLGDWHTDSSSVCVNAGAELSDLYGIHTDLAGQPRLQNEKADIGALESPYNGEVLCRNMEISIYEGESYTFYDTTLTTTGWYEHRWNVGEADSLVVLHLIAKQVVYVSVTGAGSKDGSSWANALDGQTATANGNTKLADALQAATAGTEFWIQSGTYYACSDSDINKSLILNEGVALYGGFIGTETEIDLRDTNTAPTVFSGNLQNDTLVENYSRNIFKTNDQNKSDNVIVLDNISITEGYNYFHDGCALHIGESSFVRANRCRIHHNFGSAIANEGHFVGNYCTLDSNISYSDYWVSYNIYYNFHIYYEGAAAFSNKLSGIAYFHHCNISHNHAPDDGALFNRGIMAIDSSCISHNEATDGCSGAIFSEGKLTITNTTLSYNRSYNEFSTVFSIGSLVMNHCDINNNESNRINPLDYWLRENFYAFIDKSAHVFVDGTAEVSHCTFTHNTQNGGSGGGCLHIAGDAHIHHCEFVDNIGSGSSDSPFRPDDNDDEEESGGGIVISFAMRSMYNDGGGVHVERGDVSVEDCVFDRHFGMNGCVATVYSGKLTMDRCVFTRNNSEGLLSYDDGLLTLRRGELFVNNSLFANNQIPILTTINTGNSNIIFTNCTFANNGSNFCHFRYPSTPFECDSTWINTDTAHVTVTNCIISGDWSTSSGSECSDCGCFYPNYTLNFTNTLFDTLHSMPQTANTANLASQTISVISDSKTGVIPTISLDDAQKFLANQQEGNLMVRYDAEMQDYVGYSTIVMSEKKGPVGEKSSAKDGSTSDCTPDSLGNIYYCDPMFVNPTTVMGVDSAQNPLLYDFRLQDGSPAINSGDTTGLHLTADATDLDGEQRVKRCQIDRGCYEYGTIVYDTVQETLCVEQDALSQLSYNGHGFNIAQLEVGENTFTRTCDCHPDANDSVQTLQLSVSLIQHSEFDAVACDSFSWHDETFTASGIYTRTFTDATGCDSIVTLHLTINSSNSSEFSESVCESFVWNNETFFISSDYTRTLTNAAGCDSLVILHLTVNHGTHNVETETACENYEWHGVTYTTSGIYTYEYTNATGCASADTLHLTVNHGTHNVETETACENYEWHGVTYTTSGIYTYVYTNATGCASADTLYLTVNHGTHNVETETACESYTWHGTEYTASGTYTYEYTNNSGCASIDTLHLTINFATSAQFTVTTADSCYIWNSQPYCTSGDYTQTFQTVHGCDSTITLHLTITVGIDDHNLGASMTVYPNPTTGVVNVQCTMNNGQAGAIEFQLFDAFGRLLRSTDDVETCHGASLRTDTHGSSVQTAQIDLSHYAAGVYFIKAVADGNVVAVRKLIKN